MNNDSLLKFRPFWRDAVYSERREGWELGHQNKWVGIFMHLEFNIRKICSCSDRWLPHNFICYKFQLPNPLYIKITKTFWQTTELKETTKSINVKLLAQSPREFAIPAAPKLTYQNMCTWSCCRSHFPEMGSWSVRGKERAPDINTCPHFTQLGKWSGSLVGQGWNDWEVKCPAWKFPVGEWENGELESRTWNTLPDFTHSKPHLGVCRGEIGVKSKNNGISQPGWWMPESETILIHASIKFDDAMKVKLILHIHPYSYNIPHTPFMQSLIRGKSGIKNEKHLSRFPFIQAIIEKLRSPPHPMRGSETDKVFFIHKFRGRYWHHW